MNTRIEQLTRTYLDGLLLTYYSQPSDEQKRRIIKINGQTEWIIFNAGSLEAKPGIGNRRHSFDTYDIVSPQLREIFQEVVKIYGKDDLDRNNIEVELFHFSGGSGLNEPGNRNLHNRTQDAIPIRGGGRGNNEYWIAVNKKECGERFEEYIKVNDVGVNNDRRHWKIENRPWNFLNNGDIVNSQERVPETPTTPNNSSTRTQPNTPNPTPQLINVSFTIDTVKRQWEDLGYFILKPTSAFSLLGKQIIRVYINGTSDDFQEGSTINISNIQLEPGRASIDNGNELFISTFYDNVQVTSRNSNPSSSQPNTPQSPNNPPTYNEVKQKNQLLSKEEDSMFLLAAELLEVITEKNKKVRQEGQTLGLNLSELPADVLDYFQEEFFELLDENQPLNSSRNSQINTDNGKIKQKKLNIKNNIYRIYDSNVKKLADWKRKIQNGSPSTPPENELTKTKKQVIEKINKVLTDPDNLRNIDLNILANGKYQNWENDIEKLTTKDEVIAYGNAFFAALKETGAKEKEQEEKDNKISSSTGSQNSPENNPISVNTKKMISSLPLPTAKNIAKNQIRELFNKYKPDLEKLKEIWKGEKNWMSYLEKCDSSEKVAQFLEKIQLAIIEQSQSQGSDKNKKPANSWIPPLIIIILLVLTSLAIIIKFRYKKKIK